jgi:DNA-binding transcriptional LysR family regulator
MGHLPDLEALAIFARIVENHGIGAAAAELGLSTPTVSKALARLEQRLGARLFNRTPRRLVLTEAGRQLAEHAARLLAEAEAAEAALRSDAAAPRGPVRLAVPMSFGLREVAPILPMFLEQHPGVSIDLHLDDALVDIVGDGFDLALRIGELPDSSLLARRLAGVSQMVVAAPAYLDHRGRPTHPAELAAHDCFRYANRRTRDVWVFRNAAGEEARVRPSGRLQVNNGDAVLPAAIAGLGIADMPAFIVQEAVAEGLLEPILADWSVSRASLFLLMPPQGPQPTRVRVLADFLAERLSRG